MKRIWAAGIMAIIISPPASAAYTPLYAGLQLDNISGTALLGYQISKTYAVEAHYSKSDSRISQSGITAKTNTTTAGLVALAMLPMKLQGGSPYFLFGKAGYVRINKDETYSIPVSVTLTTAFSGTVKNIENRVLFGGGVQYNFYESLSGRAGIEAVGYKRSVYIGAILKF